MKYLVLFSYSLIISFTIIPATITAQDKYEYIEIHDLSRKPIIQAILNGKEAYFLLDTGSNITLLNLPDRSRYGFTLIEGASYQAIGLGGRAGNLFRALKVNLFLGSTQIKARYMAYDMTALVKNIHKRTRIEISGIIGSDVRSNMALL